jgi:23S rRNA pseudouridine2605 synthase
VYKRAPNPHKTGIGKTDLMNDSGNHGQGRGEAGGERLAKVIARAGLASRREAEAWIAAGRVAVNGAVVRSPACNVGVRDRVSVDGAPLPARERTRLFLYHKPRGLVTSHSDPQGRPTIFQSLPEQLPRLISVGRLDYNTEGLMLLTNDGALARVLELPSTGWLRRYRVRAHGSVSQQQLDALRQGVTIEGVRYGAVDATLDRLQGTNVWVSFGIREGKNREVRNVLGHLGLTVARLIRVSFGPFQIGELAPGAVEEVRTRVLREQLGERLIAAAGCDFSAPMVRPQPEKAPDAPPPKARRRAPGDKPPSHSWRKHDDERPPQKLRRRYHGPRRREEAGRSEQPAAAGRGGLLTDRKGRRVVVERRGTIPSTAPSEGTPHAPSPPRASRQRRGREPPRRGGGGAKGRGRHGHRGRH